ncbi:hypothetical protein BCON_0556g00020 [Botryotinia convoluta]|uniref:Uncharacterized protein n=1 Tax=Botryotinia convoluta TaxID=54673 RepID=A0A4Z1H543_9HELO|nr:hypothetical protein BCON_0556g00020 [Botryotinia convoluta]
MANSNTKISISSVSTSEVYFPILTQQCPILRLTILQTRSGNTVGTDCTPGYTPPTATTGDPSCDGILFLLNPQGNSRRAKCSAVQVQYSTKLKR